ncbi:MAG: AzlC family ABC transporter permease [Gammaproteobacteria bacterium]|nr:AzlC family ABC transporter permease [Gammaproteobacteria bacterium]
MTNADQRARPQPNWTEFRRGVAAMAPALLGLVPFALVLGAEAARKGLSPLEVLLLCGMNFAGGSEFVAVELWNNPIPFLLIVGMTLLVNSRHVLMGAALAPHLRHLPKRKALLALFFMADEVWAFGIQDARKRGGLGTEINLPFYAGLAAALYLSWISMTVLGALVGPLFGDPSAYGFDMAFPAVFLVLLKGLWTGYRAAAPWLVSLVAAAAVHLLVPGAWYVLAGTLAGLATAYIWPVQQ